LVRDELAGSEWRTCAVPLTRDDAALLGTAKGSDLRDTFFFGGVITGCCGGGIG
jgi:hypothetical protein